MIAPFCRWLSATELSLLFQTIPWVIPLTQSVHIMCIGVVVASMTLLDLRLIGLIAQRHTVADMTARFLPFLWPALGLMALTGAILITAEPARELLNPAFRLKMCLLLAALAASLAIRRHARDLPAPGSGVVSTRMLAARVLAARVMGAASLLLWAGMIVCGRWIAYSQ